LPAVTEPDSRAPIPRRRPSPAKVRGGLLRNMPASIRYGVPLVLLVLLGRWLLGALAPDAVRVAAVGFQGAVVAAAGLPAELYPYDDTGAGDYPPQRLRAVQFDAEGRLSLPTDELGSSGAALLVARTPDNGIAWAHIDPARRNEPLEFGVPQSLVGRIVNEDDEGIAGAVVQVLTDRYGVILGETSSDGDGGFAVGGLSSSNTFFTLRARAAGHAVATEDVQLVRGAPVKVQLERTLPLRGTLALPAGVAPAGLVVRAFRVPGVAAPVAADGAFALDHLPAAPTRVRLLVAGLPSGFTHPAVTAVAGDQSVSIRVTRAATISGLVVLAQNDAPVAGAYVEHPHGPRGKAAAYSDSRGRFELDLAPPGTVRIEAFRNRPAAGRSPAAEASTQLAGFAEVEVEAGADVEGVVIRVF
jgi:hypothetical protein